MCVWFSYTYTHILSLQLFSIISYYKMLLAIAPCAASDSLWPCGLQPPRPLCPRGFSRQAYWSGLSRPPPGDLPNPGVEPKSPTIQVDSLPTEPPGKPKILEWAAYPFSRDLPDPGIKPGSPALQADSLPAELLGKRGSLCYTANLGCLLHICFL